MAIEEITITNFRNLLHTRLLPSPSTNLIIGNNGSGKTSLLETIYYLGTARSFRTPHSKFLINHEAKEFTLFSKIGNDGAPLTGVGISRDRNNVKIKVANQSVSTASRLAELLPVQLINPDVHKLMEDGPRYRRRFIEWGVFHVKPSYLSLWQQCTHILKQRNAALRLSNGAKQLDYWDKALSDVTDQITKLRLEYIAGLQPVFDRMISGIKGLSRITIQLKQGWPDNKNLIEALQESRALDQKKGFSQFGPHRADLRIMLGAIRAKDLVSRGQQKIITALLKVAQVRCLLDAKKDSSPVILVDDLPAELDEDFRIVLMKEIDNLPVQSFITGTCVDNFPVTHLTKPFQVFHVEHGQVEPLEISIN